MQSRFISVHFEVGWGTILERFGNLSRFISLDFEHDSGVLLEPLSVHITRFRGRLGHDLGAFREPLAVHIPRFRGRSAVACLLYFSRLLNPIVGSTKRACYGEWGSKMDVFESSPLWGFRLQFCHFLRPSLYGV